MHTLSLGPFFSHGHFAESEGDGMFSLGCRLEFATSSAAAVAPIYYRHHERSRPGIWDLFVFAADIPYPVNYHPGFAQSTSRGLFLPLDEVLLFLYRKYSVRRLVSDLLTELRSKIASPVSSEQPPRAIRNGLLPQLETAGFFIESFFLYGRSLSMNLRWLASQDLSSLSSPVECIIGTIHFRPQPDRTLDNGTWYKPRWDILGLLLKKEMRSIVAGPPRKLLSEEGYKTALQAVKWRPFLLLTATQARHARMELVKKRTDLWNNPRQLARLLSEAGLYSETTPIGEIAKRLPRLIKEAG